MRFVKKRRGPKIGTKIGVKNRVKFLSERGYEIRHGVFFTKRGYEIGQKEARSKNRYKNRGKK